MTEQAEFDLRDIKCAEGKRISVGSVLRRVETGEIGVVIDIKMPGDRSRFFEQVGDLVIEKSPGICTVTNMYTSWKHVPHNQQTYRQRWLSWLRTCCDYGDDANQLNEHMVVDGIVSLLDQHFVEAEWDYPSNLSDALCLMSKHLEQLSGQAV